MNWKLLFFGVLAATLLIAGCKPEVPQDNSMRTTQVQQTTGNITLLGRVGEVKDYSLFELYRLVDEPWPGNKKICYIVVDVYRGQAASIHCPQ